MALNDALMQFNALVDNLKNATGKGIHEVLQKELISPHYDVTDKDEEIQIDVKLENIGTHSVNLIEVKIRSLSVEVKVRNLANTDHFLKISRLREEINVSKSKYKITKDSIRVTLVKLKHGKWPHVHYHHPDVFKSFQDKIKTASKSIPLIKGFGLKTILGGQVMWNTEVFAMCGLDHFMLYLDSPAVFKTHEQIIEEIKIKCKDPYVSYGVVLSLFSSLLAKERREYEDSHPEALKFYESKIEEEGKKKTQNEKKAETLKLNGNRFIKRSKYFEAIQSYTEAINLDPQCPIYYLNRAIAYYNINFYVLALEDTAKALSIDPFYCKAYYYMGETLLHDCFPDDALNAFKRAKIIDPLNRKIEDKITEAYEFRHHFCMFIESVRQGNEEDREKHLKGILKVMESSVAAERLFKHLCDKGMIAEAKVEAIKLGRLHKYDDNMKFYFLAISSYYEDDEIKFNENFKKYTGSQKPIYSNMRQGYELCDSIADIFANRSKGDEMYKKGHYKKAIEFYLKAQKNPDIIPLLSSQLLLKIGLAKKELKDKDSFLYFHESINVKNDNHEALAARGEFFLQEGQFEMALIDLARAKFICPCKRYSELIEKAKASISGQENGIKNHQISESRRKAVKKKEEGNKFFQAKDFRTAIKCYSEAIELDDSDEVFYSNRGACYINIRKFDDALKDCQKAVELNPSFAKGHFRLGQCYLAKGEMNEAQNSLDQALKLKPKDEIVQKELQSVKDAMKDIDEANKFFDDEHYEEAAKLFTSIVEKTKAAVDIYNKWMECFMRLGRFEDALIGEQLFMFSEGDFQFHYKLGICHLHERMLYYAHRDFKHALQLDSLNETLKTVVEYLSEKSEYFDLPDNKEREEIVQKIFVKLSSTFGSFSSESDQNLSKSKQALGDAYFEEENYQDALHLYTEALSLTPHNCSLYVSRASCYVKLKLFMDAISEIKEALDVDGESFEAFNLLGNIEIIMGNPEKAKSAFKEAEKLDPQNEKSLGLAKALKLENILEQADRARDNGDLQKAVDLYKEALEISPASHCIYEKYGECYLELKPFTSFPFEEIFDGIKLNDFQIATECYLEGLLYYSYGNDKCIHSLESAVKRNPSNEKYKKWLKIVTNVFGLITKTLGALTQNDFQSSLNYLNEALQISEDNPFLFSKITYLTGVVKCKQKELDEAIEWFTKSHDKLREKTNFHSPGAVEDEKIWKVPRTKDYKIFTPTFKEREFKGIIKTFRQILLSSLEKRAYCYKLQNDFKNALKDYSELYNYTREPVYLSICHWLPRIKNTRN